MIYFYSTIGFIFFAMFTMIPLAGYLAFGTLEKTSDLINKVKPKFMRNFLMWLSYKKPFTCPPCMSFWATLLLAFFTNVMILIALPSAFLIYFTAKEYYAQDED